MVYLSLENIYFISLSNTCLFKFEPAYIKAYNTMAFVFMPFYPSPFMQISLN